MINVNIINTSANPLPSYATEGASGMDLRAHLVTEILLKPMERFLVPTGLYIEIPAGYEAQVRPRSGLALKQGITCLNTPGTIDSDYRGEIKILLINLSNETQVIRNNDRVAQLVISKVEKAALVLVQQLEDTVRATGGFGHTGIQ
ncbi:MAG TPA: dUTP diphosphatase [Ferruginibacter sp.]|nr:dUTP diphosphatase [Ferruginibacter sp.]